MEQRASASCGVDVAAKIALLVEPWTETTWDYVEWVAAEARPVRALFQIITGPCASEVIGGSSFSNLIKIASGPVFNFSDPDRPRPSPEAQRVFEPDLIGAPPPPLPGAVFVRAEAIDAPRIGDGGQRDYVGLWSDRRGFIIASFSVIDGLGAGPAHPLVRSRDPIRGLVYGPAPDVQAGSVSFVQFGRDGVVRLLGFGWDHPDAFPCLTPEQLVTRVPNGVAGLRRSDRRCG